VVRADLHFSQTSHKTPEGDLAAYVMDLAEEDPDLFGASIVFRSDRAAERAFEAKHGGAGSFKSPDPLNAKNLPHARLAELRATDVVDEPAANPSGLFHASGIPADAEALLDYALGLKDARPAASSLGIDPDRLRAFTARFMDRHGLTLKPLASPPAAGRRPARESAWAEHARRFGAEAGLHYFSLGLSVEAAAAIHGTRLAARLLRHDAAADLTATQAGGVFGLDAAGWSAVAPPPDFESRGHGYWRATSLAAWIAGGFRGRSGTPRPELLARFGGTEPEVVWTPRELALGSVNLAKVADGIKLPG
ncbi:MAG TPA: hypothetical protein VF170_00820, partial [Planctomycetaceae bacterium]